MSSIVQWRPTNQNCLIEMVRGARRHQAHHASGARPLLSRNSEMTKEESARRGTRRRWPRTSGPCYDSVKLVAADGITGLPPSCRAATADAEATQMERVEQRRAARTRAPAVVWAGSRPPERRRHGSGQSDGLRPWARRGGGMAGDALRAMASCRLRRKKQMQSLGRYYSNSETKKWYT